MVQINGPFKDIIPNFQKYKKSLGYKYDNIHKYYRLDKILFDNNIVDLKDSKKIYEVLVTNETNLNKKNEHYSALKELYKYMKLMGYDDLYFESLCFSNTSNFEPTILTKHQLKIFFETLDSFCKTLEYPKCYIFPVLFRLLYSNGLRIKEALDLKVINYSAERMVIYIEKSKENVSRELPLENSMREVLKEYENLIPIKNQTYLFELNGKKISKYQVDCIFKGVLFLLNFKFRKHDLRHTMAVTTFNNLFDKGYNEQWILYYLHIYLGHRDFKSTEYYLRYTKNRYKKMVKKVTKTYPNIFPKVGDINE